MNKREKTKELIRENIFAIHEAFELNKLDVVVNIAASIRYRLSVEYKGHKIPLKDFVYNFMGNDYRIRYIWSHVTSRERRRIIPRNGNPWNKVWSDKF